MPPTRSPLHRRAAVLAAALVTITIALTALASPATAEGPAPDRGTSRFEVDFLRGMIDHHGMAVEMADMCIDKAVHEELRAMCEDIKTSQSDEIGQMQGWLQDWYGMSHEAEMTRGEMRQMDKLTSLSGASFETRFMDSMIEHHRKAIREADSCLERADHGALVDRCQDIISTQTAEISQMQQWSLRVVRPLSLTGEPPLSRHRARRRHALAHGSAIATPPLLQVR